jgi:hypothetical protein
MSTEFDQLRFLVDTIKAKDEIIRIQQEALDVFEEQLNEMLVKQKQLDEQIERINNKI